MITVHKITVLGTDGKYQMITNITPVYITDKQGLEHFRSTLKVRYQTTDVRFEYEEEEV